LIGTNEVLLKSGNDWLYYSKPHKVFSTNKINEVQDMLREVEKLVNTDNWHAAGFVSYEAAPAFDKALQVLDSGEFPLLWFGLYSNPQIIDLPLPTQTFDPLDWNPTVERNGYNTAIEKIKEHIAQGRTYQVNYTMRLQAEAPNDAWNFFLHIAKNQNKYAACLNTGRYAICSASPELFFKLNGETISSRPMKGTVKRGRTTAEDSQQAEWLHQSVKNRAENVMIVDMIRNDIGRIAETGSVHVPELFKVEKYPTLFQMTSTVEAKTKASVADIFRALFPCASITGAPKVSTMKIISELESSSRRIYTGSIGYIAPQRKAQFNVAIRTAIIDQEAQTVEYGVGGGIVWDSTSTDEYSEALLKAQVLTKQSEEFSLLETMLWTPEEGYFLLNKHIARMADSASYFDFSFPQQALIDLLEKAEVSFTAPQRLRITLDRSGIFKYETREFTGEDRIFKVKLASTPINSENPFYFHKTTNRGFYPAINNNDDILLYNEKDELTEFTIGNLVVKIDGGLFTPPISCGLLAGTFRESLIEGGQVKERVIRKNELKNCQEVFLVNSVRKWVPVEL
jgi:para-aminobenzoate synthetase/4-amino-4-deoxychorismate lyase